MNATVKANPAAAVIRLDNGVTLDIRTRTVEVWAPGAKLLHRGPSVPDALTIATAYNPEPSK